MKLKYFKLKKGCGNHAQVNPRTGELESFNASEGKVIKSIEDLVKIFPDKFEAVEVGAKPFLEAQKAAASPFLEAQKAAASFAKELEQAASEKAPIVEEEEEEVDYGKDVTEKFEIAADQDYLVYYKKGIGFNVFDKEDTSAPLNSKKLKKAQVVPFIESLLE